MSYVGVSPNTLRMVKGAYAKRKGGDTMRKRRLRARTVLDKAIPLKQGKQRTLAQTRDWLRNNLARSASSVRRKRSSRRARVVSSSGTSAGADPDAYESDDPTDPHTTKRLKTSAGAASTGVPIGSRGARQDGYTDGYRAGYKKAIKEVAMKVSAMRPPL